MDRKSFEQLLEAGDFGNPVHSVQEWDVPIPFSNPNTPDFPVESLPGAVAAFVEQLAASTQTPEEMAGILSLGILATAFQSRYEVEITPDWKEPLCLYPVAVAPPGERKSAVISALSAPVYEYEAEQREFEAAEIAQNQTERVLLEKALQAAQNSAAKGKGNFEAKRQEALDLSAQLANFKELHPFRLIVDDTTPEKLVDMMELQGGCITVASAEGGVFDSLSGRYDRTANFDIYLKGHAGDTISVDRIGRKSNYIAKPRLTMILTIQPSVLYGLMDNATFRGRGLCGRFLYAMCKSKVGRREVSPAPVSSSTRAEYRQFVRRILADQGSGIVKLSPDANTIREEYQAYIEKKLGGEWEHMRDWGGKLVGAMVRIAALLHKWDTTSLLMASSGYKEDVKTIDGMAERWSSTVLPSLKHITAYKDTTDPETGETATAAQQMAEDIKATATAPEIERDGQAEVEAARQRAHEQAETDAKAAAGLEKYML